MIGLDAEIRIQELRQRREQEKKEQDQRDRGPNAEQLFNGQHGDLEMQQKFRGEKTSSSVKNSVAKLKERVQNHCHEAKNGFKKACRAVMDCVKAVAVFPCKAATLVSNWWKEDAAEEKGTDFLNVKLQRLSTKTQIIAILQWLVIFSASSYLNPYAGEYRGSLLFEHPPKVKFLIKVIFNVFIASLVILIFMYTYINEKLQE